MRESFTGDNASITQLLSDVASGKLVQVHAGYHNKEHSSNCTDITDSLAAFLIAAGTYSYYGCSLGWYTDTWSHWNPEYSRPLGEPRGLATYDSPTGIWTRHFAAGVTVTFNAHSNVGRIDWNASDAPRN